MRAHRSGGLPWGGRREQRGCTLVMGWVVEEEGPRPVRWVGAQHRWRSASRPVSAEGTGTEVAAGGRMT